MDFSKARSCFGCSKFSSYVAITEATEVPVGPGKVVSVPPTVKQVYLCMDAEDGEIGEDEKEILMDSFLSGGHECLSWAPFDPTSEEDGTDDEGNLIVRQLGESTSYLESEDDQIVEEEEE